MPDTKAFFPELKDESPRLQINQEWKLEVDPEQYFPGASTTNSEPGVVIFLERHDRGTRSTIEPLDFVEAQEKFEIIWPWSVGWTTAMDDMEHYLLAGKAFRFCMNGSPDEAVEVLEGFLKDWKPQVDG